MTHFSLARGLDIRDLDVLIVEDNPYMRKILLAILRAFKVKNVRQAVEGGAALAEMRASCPNLVITDWEMAPMNGHELLQRQRLRTNKPACFVPSIVLTAHGRKSLVREAFDAGATQFLVKPVTAAALLQRIEWVLDDNRPYDLMGAKYIQKMKLHFPGSESGDKTDAIWMIDAD